jgi:hypothetical protein
VIDMASGGARNRSGPQPDPTSLRSASREIRLTALPSEGYGGDVPDLGSYLPVVTARHESIWAELWKTPQACAWSLESWRWPIVADLVEYRVRVDDPESPASLVTSIRQLRDDLGLSAAGLKANGWAIAVDQLAQQVAKKVAEAGTPKRVSARDRIKVVANGDGA